MHRLLPLLPLPLLLLLLLPHLLPAQALRVQARDFRIDRHNALILVQRAGLREPLQLEENNRTTLELGRHTYTFTTPPASLGYTAAYPGTYGGDSYTLYFTELPLLDIRTEADIPDEPKISAEVSYVDGPASFTATAGIETRGGFSQSLPKKTYDLEFWTDATGTENQDVSMAGLRNDDDWVLDALYNEPLRIRSYLASKLWLDLHTLYYQEAEPDARAGADVAYAELFLNGRYRGLYNISEQVDRKLLQLRKYREETRGELYKAITRSATGFSELPGLDGVYNYWGGYSRRYPEPGEGNWERLYDFTEMVMLAPDAEFNDRVWQDFDYGNYIDYDLFINLIRATDNSVKNLYLGTYDHDQPYFYVPWDLDAVMGNLFDGSRDNAWRDIRGNELHARVRELQPGNYTADLSRRWFTLRQGAWSRANLLSDMEKLYHHLREERLYEREALVWPNYPFDRETLDYLTGWMDRRLDFLDNHFDQLLSAPPVAEGRAPFIYPNPTGGNLILAEAADLEGTAYCIFNSLGQMVGEGRIRGSEIPLAGLLPGQYILALGGSSFRFAKF